MDIKISIPVNLRKKHTYSNQAVIKFPAGVKPMDYRDYVLASVLDWFEEYDNQPTATQLHPQ